MGVSINWLKDYVDYNWTAEELAHELTMAGIAVEGIEKVEDDYILEMDLTPNRGDCLGIINLAREIAALNGNKIKIPQININESSEDIKDFIRVEIEAPDLCRRYLARLVKNVKIKDAPEWMQKRLINAGIRPINNVVDITNYVMLESNQPLHAFDYDLLGAEKKIVVRRAGDGEKIITLDETERILSSDDLLICDYLTPTALAGIMGGGDSEINESTTSVLLEAANFERTNIRKTSKKLALRSESSQRFEKGVDINAVVFAINRAAQLLEEYAEGEVVKGVWDEYPQHLEEKRVLLRQDKLNQLLGTQIDIKEIKGYLENLSFEYSEKEAALLVDIPSYRADIEIEVDLIEEIARLYGYENIKAELPILDTSDSGLTYVQKLNNTIKDIMSQHFFEAINYSFISPKYFDYIQLADNHELRQVVQIANPLSEEQSVMRTILLPSLLETISKNLARKNNNLRFFEMGAVFYPQLGERLPLEKQMLAAIVAGDTEHNWNSKKIAMDFYYLKGVLENYLKQMGINNYSFIEANHPAYHPGRSASLKIEEDIIGIIGEVHPQALEDFQIKVRACAMEIDLHDLYHKIERKSYVESITKFPGIERDLAFLIRKEYKASEILNEIYLNGGENLKIVDVFDVYTGDQVQDDQKSLAFRLQFRSNDRTLTDEEVNTSIEHITSTLEKKLGAKLR